jgi:FTR1 family protein
MVGVFLGIDSKLNLRKRRQILSAAIIGTIISIVLPVMTFYFSNLSKSVINEKNAELLEGYLMVFAGVFLAYVAISLHHYYQLIRGRKILEHHIKMKQRQFDYTLYAAIIFFVLREGFEIALFTTATSLFSTFVQNMQGLIMGFAVAAVCGFATTVAYIRFPLQKVFRVTEYMIMFLGAALMKNGVTELFEVLANVHLKTIIPLPLDFLPAKSTFIGAFLKAMTGIEQQFSLAKLSIMFVYCASVYWYGLRLSQIRNHPVKNQL